MWGLSDMLIPCNKDLYIRKKEKIKELRKEEIKKVEGKVVRHEA